MMYRTLLALAGLGMATGFPLSPSGRADSPTPYAVVTVKPSNPVLHGLEVKTELDAKRRFVSLRGPSLYSAPANTDQADSPNYLTWYAVRKPAEESVKRVELADQYSGDQAFSIMLGKPAYYLMPAQTIRTGPPKEIPADLNLFLAFEIVDVDSVSLPEPTPGKPAFVCLPAEEWHHAEHFPIKSAKSWLMVYEVEATADATKATTIDQFGLNGLTVGQKKYVYVAAEPK